ncbi:dolichol kinase EVAN isoform X2 [Amborella trichopoda]|uniref:dolichol kinase EVAN isoform X2 n=1 Tax=Amborella trichopoda TaxID=13333 RepID=UPI0005D3438A|nr:dolichol kinase EVAN isoform X2 [Amborella trichopoda]|eukprot:XP_011620501.1 dolichol kinase EVAN isoform X2 [Amborella trichopoda]
MAGILVGERVVVFLIIARVLFSVFRSPSSLLVEGVALCLLALVSFMMEILIDCGALGLSRFKTRPGASSGILLGATTLPTVFLSRMIQLCRALPEHHTGEHEHGILKLQYWAASVSSLGVLMFLSLLQRNLSSGRTSFGLGNMRHVRAGMLLLVIYVGLCYLSLTSNANGDSYVATMMLWILFQGLVSVKLIQQILLSFPSCASIGEALLVTGSLVLYFADMFAFTLSRANLSILSSKSFSSGHEDDKSKISTIIQGVLVGLLLLPLFYKSVLWIWFSSGALIKSETHAFEGRASAGMGRSLIFYASLGIMLILVVPAWLHYVHVLEVHPASWILSFIFTEPLKRLMLCIYWLIVICFSVFRFYNISKSSKIERILLRKYYHLVAVIMFVPALIFQPDFLDLAFGGAVAVFLVLEMIRVWKIWPLGDLVDQFMNAFTDHRDSDILIVSHFSLLLGCALPKWMSARFYDRPLVPFAGILSLGIGDTMASMVGYKYGVLRWSKTGKKTVEGTAAGITSVLFACSVLLPLLASKGYILSQHWLSLAVAVTLSGLLEAYTTQLDNAFIPLVFYGLLCL